MMIDVLSVGIAVPDCARKVGTRWTRAGKHRARNLAMAYKARVEQEIEYCRLNNLPIPDPVPHPDHIELAMRTGQVVVDGPITSKQRDKGRQLVAKLLECRRQLTWLARTRAKAKDPRMIEIYDQEIVYETRIRDILTNGISRTPWLARELVIAAKADALKPPGRLK